jgi:hypothetical protein
MVRLNHYCSDALNAHTAKEIEKCPAALHVAQICLYCGVQIPIMIRLFTGCPR